MEEEINFGFIKELVKRYNEVKFTDFKEATNILYLIKSVSKRLKDEVDNLDPESLFVCKYDDEKIGLFIKRSLDSDGYNLYIGFDNQIYGASVRQTGPKKFVTKGCYIPRDRNIIKITGTINDSVRYDELRNLIYGPSFTKNKTSVNEINSVLKYYQEIKIPFVK